MASSSRSIRARWPFVLSWLHDAKPNNEERWRIQEYLAGIAMMQVNGTRRAEQLPPFTWATILTGIHGSQSDDEPHITIAAATDQMKSDRQHCRVHSRVVADSSNQPLFTGAECFSTPQNDSRKLRDSYRDPVYATTSLKSDPASGFAPVGCTVANGYRQWYVLDEQQSMVFLKDDVNKFYRVGEGRNEQLAFFHPVYERTFYAKFLGNERPVPHSPDPQPTNLDIAMTQLQINTEGQPYGEEVQLYLDLTKDWTEALCFHSAGQRIRTGWRKWQAIQHSDGRVYYCYESDVTGETYFTWGLPVLLVDTWWKCGSEKPIRFRVEGTEFKTVKRKWLAGKNGSFYVYVQSGKFYMCYQLPEEACG